MNKKSFFAALLVFVAVLGAEAQTIIINENKSANTVEGNGNIVTRDFDMAAFDEISMVFPLWYTTKIDTDFWA